MADQRECSGLLGSDGSGHVESQHQLVVSELLVVLQLGHEGVSEGHDSFDTLLELTVTEVLQQGAHLRDQDRQGGEEGRGGEERRRRGEEQWARRPAALSFQTRRELLISVAGGRLCVESALECWIFIKLLH